MQGICLGSTHHRLCRALEDPLQQVVVVGTCARIQRASLSRTQSEDDRITIPSPQYDQNCRLVRKRWGVTTTGKSCATRVGPRPGMVLSVFAMGCLFASAISSACASSRIFPTASYCA